MVSAHHALQQFRLIAQEASSLIRKSLLQQHINDIEAGAVYVLGFDTIQIVDVLVQQQREVYAYYACSHELLEQQVSVGIFGRLPGQVTWHDYRLMHGIIEACYSQQVSDDQVDPDSVVLPSPTRAALWLTVAEGEIEPIFLIHRSLTPLQGFSLLHRAMEGGRSEVEAALIHRQEYIN